MVTVVVVVFVVLAAVVLFAVVAVTLGRGDVLDVEGAPSGPRLPDTELRAADLDDLRFTVEYRGYRMDQVDAVLDRFQRELAARDRRIAELEAPSSAPRSGTRPGSELPRRQPGRGSEPGR